MAFGSRGSGEDPKGGVSEADAMNPIGPRVSARDGASGVAALRQRHDERSRVPPCIGHGAFGECTQVHVDGVDSEIGVAAATNETT